MPFKKGQSGNPRGGSAQKPFADALRMEIAAAGKEHKKLRQIAKALLNEAANGNLKAIKEVADRLDGRPAQAVEMAGRDGGPVEIISDVLDRLSAAGRGLPNGRDKEDTKTNGAGPTIN